MAVLEQVNIVTPDGLRLRLPSGVAKDLACRIAEAANALPKRGLEVCGLLLGEHSENEFAVKSLIPFTCRYAEGPAFRVSEGELRDTLQAANTLGDVVGIYRSRNDGSLDLDHQDRLLLGLLARRPLPVLVIRQQKNIAGEGRLLIWGAGTGAGGITSVGDIFLTRQWMAMARPAAEPPKAPPIVAQRAIFRSLSAVESDRLPIPEPPSEKRHNARMAWIAAAASVVLVALFLGWRVQRLPTIPAEFGTARPPLVVAASSSALAAGEEAKLGEAGKQPSGGKGEDAKSLRSLKAWVRYDANSTLREIAVRELARRWKDDPETLPLLSETAQSDNSETVRVAALESIARGWKSNAATLNLFEERARSDKSLAVRQAAGRGLASAEIESKATQGNGGVAANEDERAARDAVDEPVEKRPNVAELPRDSTVGSKQPQVARIFRPALVRNSTPESELPLPAPIQMAGTRPELPILQVPLPALPSGPPGPPRPLPPVTFTPPVLVKQTRAVAVPLELRRLLQHETVISLRVQVDSKGRVSRVYPPERTATMERSLWEFCADAARSWVFQPALRNDEPIPGEATLLFRVTPVTRR